MKIHACSSDAAGIGDHRLKGGDVDAPLPALSEAGARLLEAASDLAPRTALASQEQQDAFVQLYREWIMREHGMPGSPRLRSEQARVLLYAIIGAKTLGEALALQVRFRSAIYTEQRASMLRDDGNHVALVMGDPLRSGPEGLISEIWPLCFILCQLEFLAGSPLRGVFGRVRNPQSLSPETASLLFDEPLEYQASELALVIPKDQISRPVVPSANDIPAFLLQLMPTALSGRSHKATMRSLVSGMMRNDKLRDLGLSDDLTHIAARLGISEVTVRRRLIKEGTTFRQIKDGVLDELAKDWLANSDLSMELVAERLGYSDGFAFRRAFRRRNAVAPNAYRREAQVARRN